MDQMEASVETQGQYFVKVGQKVPLTEVQSETRSRFLGLGKKTIDTEAESGFDDQRVLILNADELGKYNDYTEEKGASRKIREFTMVTPDGIKTLSLQERTGGQKVAEIIDELRNGRQPAPGSGFMRSEGGNTSISIGYLPDPEQHDVNESSPEVVSIRAGLYADARPFAGSAEDFQARIQRSIDQTESPHKKVAEETSRETELANSAAEMVGALPPRV